MMRWSRRGLTLLVFIIIATILFLETIRNNVYNTVSRTIPEGTHANFTDVLVSKYRLNLNSNKAAQACATSNVELVLIVSSAVHHHEAREAIRKSWSPCLPSSWILVFFVGFTKDPTQQNHLNAEAKKYDDIIQDSRFTDTYYNLTLKSLALLEWAQKTCEDASLVMKIDDDIYLNIPKLHHLTTCIDEARRNMYTDKRNSIHLNSVAHKNRYNASDLCSQVNPYNLIHYFINAKTQDYEAYFFGGYLYKDVKADRNKNSKWYLDPKWYAPAVLPPFLSGTAYVLSSNLIPHLLYVAKREPLIELEDVYISGLLGSNALKLKLSHIDGFSRFRPKWNSICMYKDLITVHGMYPSELQIMTESVNNLSPDECDTIIVYITNFINSQISSLLPRIS